MWNSDHAISLISEYWAKLSSRWRGKSPIAQDFTFEPLHARQNKNDFPNSELNRAFPFNSTWGRPPIFWPSELSFLWSEQWHLTCAQTCASIKLGEPAMQTSNSYVIIYIHYLYTKCRQEGTRNQLASWFLVPLDEKCFFRTCVFGTFLCASSRVVNSWWRG